MKRIFLGVSVFFTALISAQNYPDYYPSNTNPNYDNSGYYDDENYFPEDYYYEYPSDYYTNDLYQGYYNDYRKSIVNVNWNRFFSQYRLAPWQVQQIMMLNDSYPSYSAWNSYYRYNPDRWYYDRFYALERILGPQVFMVFQNNYYNGYNPVVYYQNYRRQHYVTNIYVVNRYRNVNVNRYRIDRTQYHQTNPRNTIGFNNSPRNTNGNWQNTSTNGGFRNNSSPSTVPKNSGFRENSSSATAPKNNGFRNNSDVNAPQRKESSNTGFRNTETRPQRSVPQNKVDDKSNPQKNPTPGMRSSNSGQRFTAN